MVADSDSQTQVKILSSEAQAHWCQNGIYRTEKILALFPGRLYWKRMNLRPFACALMVVALAACQSPYKKKDDQEKQPLMDQGHDQSFQAFIGRLRIAVNKHDTQMLSTMMTSDFGYRWDNAPPGETAFLYWDAHHSWETLGSLLEQKFGPHDMYMVAPPQAVTDTSYMGYRVGARTVRGSWKLAYFVPGEPAR